LLLKKLTLTEMRRVHTHYDNLKVTRDAPPEVIRAAYKTLCHKFHPDKHAGSAKATQTFQLITKAYEVLSDPDRRTHHDLWISKQEADQYASPSSRAGAAQVAKVWDGHERRRHWQTSAEKLASYAWDLFRKPASNPQLTVALWASLGLLGTMLLVLHHG
jgi:curved DNA-binding protein CbpA